MQKEILPTTRFIITAIAIYLVWLLATYLLEGRIHLLQKPDPLARLIYAVIANMIIGTVIAIWLLRPSILQRFVTVEQLGFQWQPKRIIIAIVISGLVGFGLFAIQKAGIVKSTSHIKCLLANSTYIYCRSSDMLGGNENCI